jgi:hypothetical protein
MKMVASINEENNEKHEQAVDRGYYKELLQICCNTWIDYPHDMKPRELLRIPFRTLADLQTRNFDKEYAKGLESTKTYEEIFYGSYGASHKEERVKTPFVAQVMVEDMPRIVGVLDVLKDYHKSNNSEILRAIKIAYADELAADKTKHRAGTGIIKIPVTRRETQINEYLSISMNISKWDGGYYARCHTGGFMAYDNTVKELENLVKCVEQYHQTVTSPSFKALFDNIDKGMNAFAKILARSDPKTLEEALQLSFLMPGPLNKKDWYSQEYPTQGKIAKAVLRMILEL